MRKVLRYLRIAFSVTCGILCLLLIVLWVRSYWWGDYVICYRSGQSYGMRTYPGHLNASFDVKSSVKDGWHIGSYPIKREYERFTFNVWADSQVGFSLRCAFWLAAVALLALGLVPWFRWRYSLRTLLIAMTLVAVGLGLIVWAVR